MKQMIVAILLFCGVGQALVCAIEAKKTLCIGAFFGMNVSVDGGWSSLSVIPALEMALHHVNNDSTILKDYRLWYEWRDSMCESGAAIRALLDLVDNRPHKIVFLGPGCSLAARPVAEATRYWKSVQVGYSITSPIFTDISKFPHVFRTAPSETMENPARLAILKKFGWNKVVLITQLLDIYVMTKENLMPLLKSENITLVTAEGFKEDPSHVIRTLKQKDARIIIALMYEDKFRKAMCKAYHEGLYGDKIVWIIVGWYSPDWWQKTHDITCTSEQLRIASGNMIETVPLDLTESTHPIISNRTAEKLNKEYRHQILLKGLSYNLYSSFTYDAVWTIARMLHNAIPLLANLNKTLDSLEYKDEETQSIFVKLLQETNFFGMSGRVTFDKYGDRQTVIKLVQNKGGLKSNVGFYDVRNRQLNLSDPGFVWNGGRVPVAGTIRKVKIYQESLPLTITFICLATSGMIFCVFSLGLNYWYRNQRYIKMSSPHFNNVTVLGCLMCYTDVLLSTIEGSQLSTKHTALCLLRAWFLSTGFTFAFGGMFAKTYRIYKIFTNTELKKEIGTLGNNFLACRLVIYWMGNVCVLVAWQIFDPVSSKQENIDTERLPDNEDVIYDVYTNKCSSVYYDHWVVALLAYQGLSLLFGMFLAWETRNVEHPALNDSKSIALAVYNVFMFSTLTIFTEYFLKNLPTRTLLSRIGVYVCSTSTICFLFVPKIYHIKHSGRVTNITTLHTSQPDTTASK